MSDAQIRALERKKDDSPQDRAAWLQALLRAGQIDHEAVQLLALTGDAGAAAVAPPRKLNLAALLCATVGAHYPTHGKNAAMVLLATATCRVAVARKLPVLLRLGRGLTAAMASKHMASMSAFVATSGQDFTEITAAMPKLKTKKEKEALFQAMVDDLSDAGAAGLSEWLLQGAPKPDLTAIFKAAAAELGPEGKAAIRPRRPRPTVDFFEIDDLV